MKYIPLILYAGRTPMARLDILLNQDGQLIHSDEALKTALHQFMFLLKKPEAVEELRKGLEGELERINLEGAL